MNSKKNLFYPMWAMAIILCVVLVLFSLIFVSCSSVQPKVAGGDNNEQTNKADDNTPDQQQDQTNSDDASLQSPTSQSNIQATTRLATTEDAGTEYISKITFLGDSTTYGLKYYEILPEGKNTNQVWTPVSGTLSLFEQSIATIEYPETGEEISIVSAVTRKKPEILLITLGVNGIATMQEDYFISEYIKLVNSVLEASPDTIVILNTMYPVASDYKNIDVISNEKIVQGNLWIEQVAEDTGVKFLNTYETIADSNGTLPANYQNGDGIHLSTEGFNAVLAYIRTHACYTAQ